MSLTVAEVVQRVSSLLGGRPVQWAPAERLVGDYEGRQRTLEVFDAEAGEQRQLLRDLRPVRAEIERLIGGPLIVIFHTPEESERLYPAVASGRRNRELAAQVTAWMTSDSPGEPTYDPTRSLV